jgi:hypothetical protein
MVYLLLAYFPCIEETVSWHVLFHPTSSLNLCNSFEILCPENQIAAKDAYIFGLRNQGALSKARDQKLLNPSVKSLCPKTIKQQIFTV